MSALFALLVCVGLWGGRAIVNAREGVRVELTAAFNAAERTAREALQDAEAIQDPHFAERTVDLFSDSRHVRVFLIDGAGQVVRESRPASPGGPPRWFIAMFMPDLPSRTIPLPAVEDNRELRLQLDLADELIEVWNSFGDLIGGLLFFFILGAVLLYRTVAVALRPVGQLSSALARIGSGDYRARVEVGRSVELDPIAVGINSMASQLEDMEEQNRRLQEQLLTLQEEERADIARDLHDEIGPYLFAVNIDAAAIADQARAGKTAEIGERVGLIQQAVAHMQGEVRDMLGRLRPVRLVEFGLRPALDDLIDFWRARQPGVQFELQLDLAESALSVEGREAVYRLVQESLSNAIRHGRPQNVRVEANMRGEQISVTVCDDGAHKGGHGAPSYGLLGMRERIEALGGALALSDDGKSGWLVKARLPSAKESLGTVI